ncbi:HAMP domain-containing histidine kinase (plasmid) [Streptomyces sp. BHT-5-2]|uniref:sensor histidine kinase n=1 Tax=unclassified Streptomyces TaxID=2593676 RepID=UPI001C8D045C|nr:HAMP domain-containing sensor histidine kinase [Streptomyces sp. BHT-5-2]QZL09257.1 HAMP domain-containing histidine kinase [Streptomyces sp. BHT-5-2]
MRTLRPRAPRWLHAWTATLYWKAAVFITVMCCLLAAVLGILVHVLVDRQTQDRARHTALAELERNQSAYVAGTPLDRNISVNPTDLPAPLRDMTLQRHERGTQLATHQGHPVMWAATPATGGKVLALRLDYSEQAASLRGLDAAIIGSSTAAIALTLGAGLISVSRITRRLHHTARVARRISTGDLDARVNDPRSRCPDRAQDEAAAVATALDAMAASLQGRLHREQRFTADVSHELRTPLAGLHSAAELLPPGRPTEMVRDRVQALRGLTEDLLEISRLDAQVESADIDVHQLGPLAERAVRATGTATEVRVVGDDRVETDRRRLERVLGNLVINAHKHGCAPVVVTVDAPVITVRDHGDGYPAYLLDQGPQRFRSQSGGSDAGKRTGHGLGLTIATGQAHVLGATLRFSNAPDGGAVAELHLPPPPEQPQ